jgi:hypothetical protein
MSPSDLMSNVKELARMYKQRSVEKVGKKETKQFTMLVCVSTRVCVCVTKLAPIESL